MLECWYTHDWYFLKNHFLYEYWCFVSPLIVFLFPSLPLADHLKFNFFFLSFVFYWTSSHFFKLILNFFLSFVFYAPAAIFSTHLFINTPPPEFLTAFGPRTFSIPTKSLENFINWLLCHCVKTLGKWSGLATLGQLVVISLMLGQHLVREDFKERRHGEQKKVALLTWRQGLFQEGLYMSDMKCDLIGCIFSPLNLLVCNLPCLTWNCRNVV